MSWHVIAVIRSPIGFVVYVPAAGLTTSVTVNIHGIWWPAIGCDIRMFHMRPIAPGGLSRKNRWNDTG